MNKSLRTGITLEFELILTEPTSQDIQASIIDVIKNWKYTRSATKFDRFGEAFVELLESHGYYLTNEDHNGRSPYLFMDQINKELLESTNKGTKDLKTLQDEHWSLSYYVWCFSDKMPENTKFPVLIKVRLSDHPRGLKPKDSESNRMALKQSKPKVNLLYSDKITVQVFPIIVNQEDCSTYEKAWKVVTERVRSLDQTVDHYLKTGEWRDPKAKPKSKK